MFWAYDFECDKTIEEIILTLNESGPWKWIWRDKDALGPYISSVPLEGVRARIYYNDRRTYTGTSICVWSVRRIEGQLIMYLPSCSAGWMHETLRRVKATIEPRDFAQKAEPHRPWR